MNLFELNQDKAFIRYMGGKQYARKKLASFLPDNLTEMVSPFCGGGSFELYCATQGIKVSAYDNLPALVRHWNIMLERSGDVIRAANKIFPVKAKILKDLVVNEKIHNPKYFPSPEKDLAFAAIAMCMTRQGFNGYYMKTSYFRDVDDPLLDRFEKWDENYWDDWGNNNLTVELQDWETTLKKHYYDFLFCDPPYIGKEDYYGQYETKKTQYKQPVFNHEHLAECLRYHKNGWMLTYQDDGKGMLKSLYKHFEIVETRWHQGSIVSQGKRDGATEFIILKEPACDPSKTRDKIGDIGDITRVYGKYYDIDIPSENLSEWIERQFSCFNPSHPCRWTIEGLLRNVPYSKFSCTQQDVRNIIDNMLKRQIIIIDTDNNFNDKYMGYPKYEFENMNDHIKDMGAKNIPIKASPHFSYRYDETA